MKENINNETMGYFCIPKNLITSKQYDGLSCQAVLLYGLLWDRTDLSNKNSERFSDSEGEVFIYYTIDNVCKSLHCGREKAIATMNQLEKFGLIRRKSRGIGKPFAIYVKGLNFRVEKNIPDGSEKEDSSGRKNSTHQVGKTDSINTDINKTEFNNTQSSISYQEAHEVEEMIKEQIEFDILSQRNYGSILDELVLIMTDVICGHSEKLRVGKQMLSRQAVKTRLLSVDSSHIEYVIDCYKNKHSHVKNIPAYLLTALYYAPSTMDLYYEEQYKSYLKSKFKNT